MKEAVKKIGLFFGSFNPVHIGHMIIANHMVEFTDLQEVWFVVSPHSPHKDQRSLLDDYTRLEMVRLAIGDNHKWRASDIEFSLSKPSYTINTLAYLGEKYASQSYRFCLIMGADNIQTFHKWKNYESILQQHKIYVYPRIGYQGLNAFESHPKVTMVEEVPITQISATFIRQALRMGKSVAPMLAPKVWDYICDNNLYRNEN